MTGYSLHAMNVSGGDSPGTYNVKGWSLDLILSRPLPGRSVQVPDLHRSAERRLLGSVLAALLHGRAYQMHAMM